MRKSSLALLLDLARSSALVIEALKSIDARLAENNAAIADLRTQVEKLRQDTDVSALPNVDDLPRI